MVIMVFSFRSSLRSWNEGERRGSERNNFMMNKQHFHDKLLFSILKIFLRLSTTFVDQLSKDIMVTEVILLSGELLSKSLVLLEPTQLKPVKLKCSHVVRCRILLHALMFHTWQLIFIA